jgi:hypothetical protein
MATDDALPVLVPQGNGYVSAATYQRLQTLRRDVMSTVRLQTATVMDYLKQTAYGTTCVACRLLPWRWLMRGARCCRPATPAGAPTSPTAAARGKCVVM